MKQIEATGNDKLGLPRWRTISISQHINKLRYFEKIYRKSKLWLKLALTLEKNIGDELQNLIAEINEMHDPGLFISVLRCLHILTFCCFGTLFVLRNRQSEVSGYDYKIFTS